MSTKKRPSICSASWLPISRQTAVRTSATNSPAVKTPATASPAVDKSGGSTEIMGLGILFDLQKPVGLEWLGPRPKIRDAI